jgi:hypothetical protein
MPRTTTFYTGLGVDRPLGKAAIAENFETSYFFIDANPNRDAATYWVGVYVNAVVVVAANTERGIVDHCQLSRELNNCVHVSFVPSPLMAR